MQQEETLQEYIEALRLKPKEELVTAVQVALFQSHKDRKRIEQMELKHRELFIDHERLQRSLKKPSLNPITIEDSDKEVENEPKRPSTKTTTTSRKPLLSGNAPIIKRPTQTNNNSSSSSTGQYIPDGRGGQSKVLIDRNGRMHFF